MGPRPRFFTFVLVLIVSVMMCQKEQSKWYFGDYAALDFMNNGPVPILNSTMNAKEGSASVADTSGNLLLYTDGAVIYNSSHQVMLNGTNIGGHASAVQSALIIQDLKFSNLYPVFTVGAQIGPLAHSLVDMNLAPVWAFTSTKRHR